MKSLIQSVAALTPCLLLVAACTAPRHTHRTPAVNITSRTYRPYVIKGKRYYPQTYYECTQVGTASYYGENDGCQGELTASGEPFSQHRMTAAHKTLPLPCVIRVTNLQNGRSAILKVNDRGPFKKKRILDVSVAAAKKLGFYTQGLARVRLHTLVPESIALGQKARLHKKRSKTKNGYTTVTELCKRLWPTR
jgi:rare lipoprotein A (peptidoglycan hydrolase)